MEEQRLRVRTAFDALYARQLGAAPAAAAAALPAAAAAAACGAGTRWRAARRKRPRPHDAALRLHSEVGGAHARAQQPARARLQAQARREEPRQLQARRHAAGSSPATAGRACAPEVCAVCMEPILQAVEGVSVAGGGRARAHSGAGASPSTPRKGRRVTRSSTAQLVATLPACGHSFHRHCADEWLRRQNTCPVCRVRVRCLDGVQLSDRDQVVWDELTARAAAAAAEAAGDAIGAAQLLHLEWVQCSICGGGSDESSLLLCDGCEAGAAHARCVGLERVPDEPWYCGLCLSERNYPQAQRHGRQ